MSLFLTLIAASLFILLAIVLLSLGRLITGKPKLRIGMCGRIPEKKEGQALDCEKTKGCSLCNKEEDR